MRVSHHILNEIKYLSQMRKKFLDARIAALCLPSLIIA
jgi:hypothetical protein